jgi:hypothetical protein
MIGTLEFFAASQYRHSPTLVACNDAASVEVNSHSRSSAPLRLQSESGL